MVHNYFPRSGYAHFLGSSTFMPVFAGHLPVLCRSSEIFKSLFLNDLPVMPVMPVIFRARTCEKNIKALLGLLNFFSRTRLKKHRHYRQQRQNLINQIFILPVYENNDRHNTGKLF